MLHSRLTRSPFDIIPYSLTSSSPKCIVSPGSCSELATAASIGSLNLTINKVLQSTTSLSLPTSRDTLSVGVYRIPSLAHYLTSSAHLSWNHSSSVSMTWFLLNLLLDTPILVLSVSQVLCCDLCFRFGRSLYCISLNSQYHLFSLASLMYTVVWWISITQNFDGAIAPMRRSSTL